MVTHKRIEDRPFSYFLKVAKLTMIVIFMPGEVTTSPTERDIIFPQTSPMHKIKNT